MDAFLCFNCLIKDCLHCTGSVTVSKLNMTQTDYPDLNKNGFTYYISKVVTQNTHFKDEGH